jgi:hypothetical protein
VLTGYLDTKRLAEIERLAAAARPRTTDICYRTAGTAPPWFGRHGHLKEWIAQAFQKHAPRFGLDVDISTRPEDARNGNEWYELLLSSKYTIGVEGGTSILDRDGSIRECSDRYVAAHPSATFEEVEASCFPGLDGTFRGFAISPRHLEACATRTCQVLTEGEYSGVLKPFVHYIPIKKDLSNVDEVLDIIRRDDLREAVIARAHADIVQPPTYRYEGFVQFVLERALSPAAETARARSPATMAVFAWMRFAELIDAWLTAARGMRLIAKLRLRLLPS